MSHRTTPGCGAVVAALASAALAAGRPCPTVDGRVACAVGVAAPAPASTRPAGLTSQTVPPDEGRAAAILAAAQAAIGVEARGRVSGLSLRGRARRVIGGTEPQAQFEGLVQIDLQPPLRYLRRDTFTFAGAAVSRAEGFDGDAWIVQVPGVPRRRSPAATDPENRADAIAAASVRRLRTDASLLAIGLLASSPFSNAEFAYAGVAESADGRAEVVAVRAETGLAARVFFDAATHLPLMVTFPAVPTPGELLGALPPATGVAPSREGLAALWQEVEARVRVAREASTRTVEARLCFDRFREASGVRLPHRITRAIDDHVVEEWEVEAYRVNPARPPQQRSQR